MQRRSPSLNVQPRSYAFVEFRNQRDAEDAYYDMYVPPREYNATGIDGLQ